jgi:thioredoxin 1
MGILHLDGQDIMKEIQASQYVLIDCWAPWCPPCRMIAPILEDIHQEIGLKVIKVNADENEDFIGEFGVMGLPTLLLFRDGQLAGRITGFQPKGVLVNSLKKHGMIE